MAVFRNAGIELIEWWTWPSRPGDAEWHQRIIGALHYFQQYCPTEISQEHINNVSQEIGCARFRPEEVTGACASMNLPVSFNFAVAAGGKILRGIPVKRDAFMTQ
jgi:hypothetical protein